MLVTELNQQRRRTKVFLMNRDDVVASLDGRWYCHRRGPSRHNMIWSCAERESPSWRRPHTGLGGVSHATGALPVPWQQRREVGDLVIGDACERVCKPGPRINVV